MDSNLKFYYKNNVHVNVRLKWFLKKTFSKAIFVQCRNFELALQTPLFLSDFVNVGILPVCF